MVGPRTGHPLDPVVTKHVLTPPCGDQHYVSRCIRITIRQRSYKSLGPGTCYPDDYYDNSHDKKT